MKVFVSYRREDSQHIVSRLYARRRSGASSEAPETVVTKAGLKTRLYLYYPRKAGLKARLYLCTLADEFVPQAAIPPGSGIST